MPPAIPTTEPPTLAAGTTWQWTTTLDDFPPSEGWTLTYYLSGQTPISFAATPGTQDYSVSVPTATTSKVLPGTYRWVKRAALNGAVFDAGSGTVAVTPDLAAQATAGADARAHAEKMVPILEAELEARITGDGSGNESVSVGGVSISRIPTEQLKALLNQYRAEMQMARYGGKLPPVAVQFG